MSVMHPAVSHNYAKMGFYPTDNQTLACICGSIEANEEDLITFLDPCCGEGTAIAKLKRELSGSDNATTIGVELDEERYEKAKNKLNHCVHADALMQIKHKRASASMLFLNPPYGQSSFNSRLEISFIQRYIHALTKNGLLMLVVPSYVIDTKLATYLCGHFEDLCFGISPEQEFRQMVVIGRKIKSNEAKNKASRAKELCDAAEKQKPFEHPEKLFKIVPDASKFELYSSNMTSDLVDEVVTQHKKVTLWQDFKRDFIQVKRSNRNPLMPLSDWHTAQAILSGMVSGLIESDKSRMLIKGTVSKLLSSEKKEGDKLQRIEQFAPVIIGIDISNGSENFGMLYEIK